MGPRRAVQGFDLPQDRYARVAELSRQFTALGFVDAAVLAIAEARHLRRVATSDRRHFDPVATALKIELIP